MKKLQKLPGHEELGVSIWLKGSMVVLLVLSLYLIFGRGKEPSARLESPEKQWARQHLQPLAEEVFASAIAEFGESYWPVGAIMSTNMMWSVDSTPQPLDLGLDLVRFVFSTHLGTGSNRLVGVINMEPHGWEILHKDEAFQEDWYSVFATRPSGGN